MTNHSSNFTKVQSGEPTDPGVFSLEHGQQTREGLVIGTKVLSHLQSPELPTPEVNAEFLSRSPRNETYREQTCTKVKRAYWIAWDRENQASGEQWRDVAVHISDRYSILTRMVPKVSCHCLSFFFLLELETKGVLQRGGQQQKQKLRVTIQHTDSCLPLCFWGTKMSLAVAVKGLLPSSKLSVQ